MLNKSNQIGIKAEQEFCTELEEYCKENPQKTISDLISTLGKDYWNTESFQELLKKFPDDDQEKIESKKKDLLQLINSIGNDLNQIKQEQAEKEQAEKEQAEKEKNKRGNQSEKSGSNVTSENFSEKGLINLLACYLDKGESASEEEVEDFCQNWKNRTTDTSKQQLTIKQKELKFEYKINYSSQGIESFSWPEWQHETRSAVVFQKLRLLGYSWKIETKEPFAVASCLSNLLGEDKYKTEPPNGQSDKYFLSLPAVKRILLVHKDIAKSPEAQEIFSAFVISVLHESADWDWIDVRYAASAEEAYQRLQEEVFDCVLICPIIEKDGPKNLYSNVSHTTLFDFLSKSYHVPVKYITDIIDSGNKKYTIDNNITRGEDKELVTHIGSNDKDKKALKEFLRSIMTTDVPVTTPKTNVSAEEKKQYSAEENKLLKKLITYYRVFPYDIFFALLRKKKNTLPDRFNLWVYDAKDNKLHYSTKKPDENEQKKAIFLSPALHQIKNLDSLGNSSITMESESTKEQAEVSSSITMESEYTKEQADTKRFSPSPEIDDLYKWRTENPPKKTIVVTSPSHDIKNNLIAAATPLTGVSAIGHEHAIQVLSDKVKALLDGPFEQVVLKTVYQDYMNDDEDNPAKTIHWPELQAQSHHRARCLRSREQTRTLWNTGKTALESLTPKMMGEFVKKIKDNSNDCQKYAYRIIISLGSKFPQENQKGKVYRTHQPVFHKEYFKQDVTHVWEQLYQLVFGTPPSNNEKTESKDIVQKSQNSGKTVSKNNPEPFGWVEINVRHYLRECVAFHLGGNEYLSPAKVDEHFTGNYTQMLEEFVCWLEVVNDVATKWKKKVLLKLPFRGDLLHFLNEIITFFNYKCKAEEDGGIKGITLINAFKSAISENQAKLPFSPAWYGMTNAWGDAADKRWKYQMSGELLNASRNELLYAVVKAICKTDMELHISGGVVSQDDITFLQKMVMEINPKKTPKIQIGTWGLIDLNLSKSTLDNSCAKDAASDGNGRPIIENCSSCTLCKAQAACSNGAIDHSNGQAAKINPAKCKNCKQCMNACPKVKLTTGLVKTNYEYPTKEIKSSVEGFSWGGYEVSEDTKEDKEHLINQTVIEIPNVASGKHQCTECKAVTACNENALKYENQNLSLDKDKCIGCLKCVEKCSLSNLGTGLKTENQKIFTEYSKAIQPRIAFWLHDLCNGCGKCSRTFYCDSFLDRRGLDGPPMMDTRNCTGCGLCVQTCPQGAIQMFEPKNYAILLGENDNALMEWRQFLTAEQIPHLVYTKQQLDGAWTYFAEQAKKDKKDYDAVIQWRCEQDLCKEMYDKDDYKDDRKAEEIKAFIKKIENNNELLKLWYSLALSDPGQILKESPVILVDKDYTTKANVYTYESLSSNKSPSSKENESGQTETKSSELEQTPESIRECEALKDIRIDVAKRLSNLREEKR